MALVLADVRRLSSEIVRLQDPSLEVVGAVTESGGSDYAEILITIRGCVAEQCLISVGVNRSASEASLRSTLTDKVRAHLRSHSESALLAAPSQSSAQ
jgi:hypothetical protein